MGTPNSRQPSTILAIHSADSSYDMFVAAAATFLLLSRTSSLVLALATSPAFTPSASPITNSKGVPTHPTVQSETNGTHPVTESERTTSMSNVFFETCSSIDCIQALGECQFFDLETIPRGVCIDTIPFMSFAINQPSGAGLGFPILIGPAGCPAGKLDSLETVNMCFNLNTPLGGFIFPLD